MLKWEGQLRGEMFTAAAAVRTQLDSVETQPVIDSLTVQKLQSRGIIPISPRLRGSVAR